MNSWINGAKGSEVKRVIDNNFDILDKRTIKLNEDMSKLNSSVICVNFVASGWGFVEGLKTYTISIPYNDYNKANPGVEVYIKNEGDYSAVHGGYIIKESGIELQSDIPYEGKVVIR